MIQVEKLSYGFPAKDLYNAVSFTLETGRHCALIGSNGAGKSTLADMLVHPKRYLYDGSIFREEGCRIGYAGQFAAREKQRECTVFEYLSEKFLENQKETAAVCEAMAVAEDTEGLMLEYQELLDAFEAMDGGNYPNNIRRQLFTAGMERLETIKLSQLSGGEYQLLQVMREMLVFRHLLVLDEPDAFLDFGNLNGLCQLVNGYQGTLLVVTHNRFLLNHCFDKIIHLENGDIQEYDGNYSEYRCCLLKGKLEGKLRHGAEQEEIRRTEEMVDTLRARATALVNPAIGSTVNAKQKQLDRLRTRRTKEPFMELREPKIALPVSQTQLREPVLRMTDYSVSLGESLLRDINFTLHAGEKAAIVGANGTGKTILMRDIQKNDHPCIQIHDKINHTCLHQLQQVDPDETKTVSQVMEDLGLAGPAEIQEALGGYCLEGETLKQKIGQLSGGERNLLRIAMLAYTKADLLILDEPSSHLDLSAQTALEKAICEYEGAVLMVSHDFDFIIHCADSVLLVEDKTIRRMRTRSFRKMVYHRYFQQEYLETDREKQELESGIAWALQKNEWGKAGKLLERLEALSAGKAGHGGTND